jgi:hypothetical protein
MSMWNVTFSGKLQMVVSSKLNSGQSLLLYGGWTALHAAIIVSFRAYQVVVARKQKSNITMHIISHSFPQTHRIL